MSSTRILATYRLAAPAAEIESRARALAAEQSVEMPVEAIRDARVVDEIVARVEAIAPCGESSGSCGGIFEVTLGLAAQTTGNEATQLLNMLFGNCSLQPEVELVDVAFPPGYAASFPGPAFGIAGIREFAGAYGRALTCSALKPQGSTVEHLAALAGTFARAGIDVIKDDHGLADQDYSPFAMRVPAVQHAIDAANRETGGRTAYAPTFSGGAKALARQARVATDCGVRMALVAPMLVGLPALRDLRDDAGFAILAHPAFGGASRIAPPLLLGKLFRLLGADATIFPNHGGRFSYSRETCLAIATAARQPWQAMKPAMPVPAGGMTIGRVDEMLACYGIDTMLLIGGGLLAAGDALPERAREFVAKVAANGRNP